MRDYRVRWSSGSPTTYTRSDFVTWAATFFVQGPALGGIGSAEVIGPVSETLSDQILLTTDRVFVPSSAIFFIMRIDGLGTDSDEAAPSVYHQVSS